MDQLLQISGAILLLAAFAASQFGLMDTRSRTSLVLNAIGSGILATLAALDNQSGFLLLEGVWAIVSLWNLVKTVTQSGLSDSR